MVTMVGMQSDLANAVKDLLELEYNALDAYEASIARLDNHEYKQKMREFLDDHKRHIKEISEFLQKHEIKFEPGPSMAKQLLTKGKVVLANMIGDSYIVSAMKSNEEDTNTAYERMAKRDDLVDDIKDIVERGWKDEQKHKVWLETLAEAD